jgi:protein disulfide-isomerase-like protein
MFAKLRDFDLYRRIPKDLTETTTHGSILSVCASIFMLVLFVAELWAFLSMQVSTNVVIDPNTDSLLRINFNITILDMPCEFATIDVKDVLGTRQDNVTKNINKWQVDETGIKSAYGALNHEQPDLMHDIHHDLEELHANGVHAVPMDEANFDSWLDQHTFTFVNFYAPWCIWCQRLEPVWEAFAERVESDQMPVSIIKVDCVENGNLCMQQKVVAFPMLRFFKGRQAQSPDYRSDRTIEALIQFTSEQVGWNEMLAKLPAHEQQDHIQRKAESNDHPGCLISGHLLVNRLQILFHMLLSSGNLHYFLNTMNAYQSSGPIPY